MDELDKRVKEHHKKDVRFLWEPGSLIVDMWAEIKSLRAKNKQLRKELRQQIGQPINILFDGPPSNFGGRFIEVETDDGQSINAGEWIKHGGDMWALRITKLPEEKEDIR